MKRIQRKRSKGWKMPDNTIYVGRPTKWGNPFVTIQDMTYYFSERRLKLRLDPLVYCCHKSTADAIQLYELAICAPLKIRVFIGGYDGRIIENYFITILNNLHELKNKDLACWCKLDKSCHADILLKFAEL